MLKRINSTQYKFEPLELSTIKNIATSIIAKLKASSPTDKSIGLLTSIEKWIPSKPINDNQVKYLNDVLAKHGYPPVERPALDNTTLYSLINQDISALETQVDGLAVDVGKVVAMLEAIIKSID